MKKRQLAILIGSATVLLALVAIVGIGRPKEKIPMSYTAFLEQVEVGSVEEVILTDGEHITFTKKEDQQLYTTDNPRKFSFKEEMLLAGIEVKEKAEVSSVMLVQYLISGLVFVGVFYFMFKTMKRGGQGNAMAMGVKPIAAEQLKVGFSEIAGNVEAKEQVDDLIRFMKNPTYYAKVGARMPRGVIFYGPPGTGKTLMAKAIAKEADVPFFSASGSDFVQLYVGVGASRVREIFKEARKHQRAVIFIDEIDAIGKKRSNNVANSNDEKDQTLNALLTEMSGFSTEEGIIVIAATNRLDMLDDALLRPGRFDRQVEIGYPDYKGREQIISLYLKDKPISETVCASEIAKQTAYFTGAMLENLLNEAAIFAANEEADFITDEHIQRAFYTVIAGAEKKDRSTISTQDRKITAYHEAGHALVTKLVAPENTVAKVTIIPSTKGAGGFSMQVPKDKMYQTKSDLIGQLKICLAGRAAEALMFGEDNITTGASNDIEKATVYLKDYMTKYGMDEAVGLINLQILTNGDGLSNEKWMERYKEKMQTFYEETKALLQVHRSHLEAIGEALLEKETLEEKDLELILMSEQKMRECI